MKWCSLFLFLWLMPAAFAMQALSVGVNQSASAEIAQGEFNRLFVKDDRIVSVKGMPNQYQLQSDDWLGEVYLYPIETDKNIVLYLSTEKKKTVQLRLMAKPISAQTVAIQIETPRNTRTKTKSSIDEKDSYKKRANKKQELQSLLETVKANQIPDGFHAIDVKPTSRKTIQGHWQARLIKLYRREDLQLEVYELYNPESKPHAVEPALFLTKGTEAAMPTKTVAGPKESVELIKVVRRG